MTYRPWQQKSVIAPLPNRTLPILKYLAQMKRTTAKHRETGQRIIVGNHSLNATAPDYSMFCDPSPTHKHAHYLHGYYQISFGWCKKNLVFTTPMWGHLDLPRLMPPIYLFNIIAEALPLPHLVLFLQC